jgi:hypothetical protein
MGRDRGEIGSLLITIFFGFAVNLLTAETAAWWGPLRPVTRYPYIWVPISILFWVGWLLLQRRRVRVRWHGGNPYPGLEAFTKEETPVFFGREMEAKAVLRRLEQPKGEAGRRLISLVGPSGVGKSSLIHAGVLPRLGSRWRVYGPIRPASDPFGMLATAFGETSATAVRTGRLLRVEARRIVEKGGRPDLLITLIGWGVDPKLLIVDQLEDLFMPTMEEDCRLFLALLSEALDAHPTLHVLVALRPENLHRSAVAHLDMFADPVAVGPLDTDRIRDVIVLPAFAAGVRFEDHLVDLMVAEATVGDALPLLGQLLHKMYDEVEGGVMTFASYNRAGRVGGAIAAYADTVYDALVSVFLPEVVDRVLLRSVERHGREMTRRQVPREELDETGLSVMNELSLSRLVVVVGDGYELAHDALFRRWSRLNRLVEDNSDRLVNLTRLEQRALAWRDSPQVDDLLRGDVLARAKLTAQELFSSPVLRKFLDASDAEAARQFHERAALAAGWAQRQSEVDPELAKAIARAAVREIGPTPVTLLTLWGLIVEGEHRRITVNSSEGPASRSAFYADGELSRLVCSTDGRRAVLDRIGHPPMVVGNGRSQLMDRADAGDGMMIFRWSADGWYIAGANKAGTFVWDAEDCRCIYERLYETGGLTLVLDLAWSMSGDRIAVAMHDATDQCGASVAIMAFPGLGVICHLKSSEERYGCLAFSPEGDRLAATTNGKGVVIWGIPTGERLLRLPVDDDMATVIQWSPCGPRVAVATATELRLWSTDKEQRPVECISASAVPARIDLVRWSPDGGRLVTTGKGERRLTIWDGDTGLPLATLAMPHYRVLHGLEWPDDGVTAIMDDGSVIVWRPDEDVASAAAEADGGRLIPPSDRAFYGLPAYGVDSE